MRSSRDITKIINVFILILSLVGCKNEDLFIASNMIDYASLDNYYSDDEIKEFTKKGFFVRDRFAKIKAIKNPEDYGLLTKDYGDGVIAVIFIKAKPPQNGSIGYLVSAPNFADREVVEKAEREAASIKMFLNEMVLENSKGQK